MTRWQSKPPVGVQIDSSHPFAQGLVAAWLFNEGSGLPYELIAQAAATGSSGFSWSGGVDGIQGNFANSASQLIYGSIPAVGPAISVAGASTFAGFTGNQFLIERDAVNASWSALVSSPSLCWRGASASNRFTTATSQLTAGARFSWLFSDQGAASISASNLQGYVNGAPAANGVSGSIAAAASNTNSVRLGNDSNGNLGMTGSQSYLYVWNQAVTAAVAAGLAANPWQIFRPQRSTVYSFAPSGLTRRFRRTISQRTGSRGSF